MNIIRCRCGWFGCEEHLEDFNCPQCGGHEHLQYSLDHTGKFSPREMKILWELSGDIPIGQSKHIKEEFLGFPVGTHRFDIWTWFDKRYPRGLMSLAYGH